MSGGHFWIDFRPRNIYTFSDLSEMNHSPAVQMKVSTTVELSPQFPMPRVALLKGRQEPERSPETAWQTFAGPVSEERESQSVSNLLQESLRREKGSNNIELFTKLFVIKVRTPTGNGPTNKRSLCLQACQHFDLQMAPYTEACFSLHTQLRPQSLDRHEGKEIRPK